MRLLGALVVGFIGGPVLIVALGYGFAYPGWVLAIVLLVLALFAGAFIQGLLSGLPTAGQRAERAADEQRHLDLDSLEALNRGYRVDGSIPGTPAKRRR